MFYNCQFQFKKESNQLTWHLMYKGMKKLYGICDILLYTNDLSSVSNLFSDNANLLIARGWSSWVMN